MLSLNRQLSMPTCLAGAQGCSITTKTLSTSCKRRLALRCTAFSVQSRTFKNASSSLGIDTRSGRPLLKSSSPAALGSTRLATSATALHKKASTQVPSRPHQTLTLLHKTTTFLPHVLGKEQSNHSAGALEYWKRTLSEISDELSAGETDDAKVRVVGVYSLLLDS